MSDNTAAIAAVGILSPRELALSSDPKVIAAREKYRKQATELEIGVAVAFEDKELLLSQLSHFVLSERQELLVAALLKHRANPDIPVRELLLEIPMSALEFMNILREVRTAFSDFKTKDIIDKHRPNVVEAVMKGALPKTNVCMECDGEGKIKVGAEEKEREVKCKSCFGTGKITKEPEHERQVTALEVAGILKKGGPAVSVNVNNSAGDGWRSSPDFRRETDKLLYSAPQVTDVVATRIDTNTDSFPQSLPEASAAAQVAPHSEDKLQTKPLAGPEESSVVLEKKRERNTKLNTHPRTMKTPIVLVPHKAILVPKT